VCVSSLFFLFFFQPWECYTDKAVHASIINSAISASIDQSSLHTHSAPSKVSSQQCRHPSTTWYRVTNNSIRLQTLASLLTRNWSRASHKTFRASHNSCASHTTSLAPHTFCPFRRAIVTGCRRPGVGLFIGGIGCGMFIWGMFIWGNGGTNPGGVPVNGGLMGGGIGGLPGCCGIGNGTCGFFICGNAGFRGTAAPIGA